MTASLEVSFIDQLTRRFPRSAAQLNAPHESDAELIQLPGGGVLAVTTDGIVEEIEAGLYDDPWLAGWMSVVVSASDLAAVGADPLGIMVCETLPSDAAPAFIEALQRGIAAAARAHALPVLGGDTNRSARLALTTTALGIVADGKPLTRRGALPGDVLFSTGSLGLGSAYAFAKLRGGQCDYQPRARLREAGILRSWASACMDTSDGVIATLHELGSRGGLGFALDDLPGVMHPAATRLAQHAGLPPWALLAGPHGEFELLFTVRRDRSQEFVAAAARQAWAPLRLGTVNDSGRVSIADGGLEVSIDAGRVRNLFQECDGDPGRFVRALMNLRD